MLEKLHQTLRYFRKKRSLTQAQLGRMSGVGQSKISRFENQRMDLQLLTLQQVAKAVDLKLVLIPRSMIRQVEALILNQPEDSMTIPSVLDLYGVSDEEPDIEDE